MTRAPSPPTALLAALLATGLALGASPARAGDEPRVLALDGLPTGAALRLVDVDGDGLEDLLALAGRDLVGWAGAQGALPRSAPRWQVALPADVSAVEVARERRPALVALGESATMLLPLGAEAGAAPQPLAGAHGLGWRDGTRAVFADLYPSAAGGPLVVPAERGWALMRGLTQAPEPLGLGARRALTAAGTFLEESAKVTHGLPRVVGPAPRSAGLAAHRERLTPVALWALAGEQLVRLAGTQRDAYDLAFLPTKGERSLLDLDGDGVPEVLHRDGENRETRYAYFRLPTASDPLAPPPQGAIAPPFSFLRLSGFNLDPFYVDLDGDRRLDVVITSIEIDAQNTMRAVASGKVTAVTRAYLLRVDPDGRPSYPAQPDAAVSSDVGVRIRFGFTGNLDVRRSFTIVADGDLDGDGRKDLLIRVGTDALLWRRGVQERVWAADPVRLAIPPLRPGEELEAHAADLDGDRKDEILLHVRAAPGAADRLLVLDPP